MATLIIAVIYVAALAIFNAVAANRLVAGVDTQLSDTLKDAQRGAGLADAALPDGGDDGRGRTAHPGLAAQLHGAHADGQRGRAAAADRLLAAVGPAGHRPAGHRYLPAEGAGDQPRLAGRRPEPGQHRAHPAGAAGRGGGRRAGAARHGVPRHAGDRAEGVRPGGAGPPPPAGVHRRRLARAAHAAVGHRGRDRAGPQHPPRCRPVPDRAAAGEPGKPAAARHRGQPAVAGQVRLRAGQPGP